MALKEIKKRFRPDWVLTRLWLLTFTSYLLCKHVEKIRINTKKRVTIREYTDSESTKVLELLHDLFAPLVKECF